MVPSILQRVVLRIKCECPRIQWPSPLERMKQILAININDIIVISVMLPISLIDINAIANL